MNWATVARRAALWCAALCLCAVTARRATATQPEPLSVVLWLHEDAETALVERVRGQTSDLDVTLEVVRAPEPLAARATQTVRAWELARKHGADVVVWFQQPDPRADRVTIQVAVPARERLLVRIVGDESVRQAPGLGSATLEAAALVIRGALRAVAAGDVIGVETRPQPAPPPATATHAPQLAPHTAPPPPPPPRDWTPPGSEPEMGWHGALYWNASWDGVASSGHHGPGLAFGPTFNAVELGLFADLGLGSTVDTNFGELTLARHALGLRAGLRLPLTSYLEWMPGVRAGLVIYQRSTGDSEAGVSSTDDRLALSVLLGPEARFGLGPVRSPLRVIAAAGLDLVPQVLRAGYEVDGRFEPALTTGRLQPRLSLGAEMRLGE